MDFLTSHEMACMREDEPFHVFMLDLDPAAAARTYVDRHVSKGIISCAQLLSCAWHSTANDFWTPLAGELNGDSTPWIKWVKDSRARVEVGEQIGVHWELFGQPIYAKHWANRPLPAWAAASGGNYRWVWEHAMALIIELAAREARHLPGPEQAIWTLEAVPPPLLDSAHVLSEIPPQMPEHLKVLDADGFYDSVASYRNYYRLAKAPLHAWTNADAPSWLKD